ncbi:MAG TPA: amino acid racemase [Gemmatimonadales bacterium]|jgi:aspartate racemase
MKIVGLIGGIAPPSTVDYYRLIIAVYRERKGDGSYPQILINSLDLARLKRLFEANRLAEVADWITIEIERLARAGADFGVLTSNTPHLIFDELARRSPIPLLSIVEAVADFTQKKGHKVLGLLGTRFTMEGRAYPDVFARRGMTVRVPSPEDQAYVHDAYMQQLVVEDLRPETREGFLAVVERLKGDGVDGVLLAGTEIPLLMRGARDVGIPLIDTARIHVERVVAEILT